MYLRVTVGADPAPTSGVSYDLEATVFTPPPCIIDPVEPNDSLATATPITPPLATVTRTVCPNDEDWYAVPVTAGDFLTARALNIGPDSADQARLEIFDSVGTLVVAGSLSTISSTITNRQATETGTWYVRVTPGTDAGPIVGVAYDLEIEVTTPPACVADALEPNDTPQTASPISSGVPILSSVLCAGDVDVYAINALAGDFIDVSATSIGPDSSDSARVRILSPAGQELDVGITSTATSSADIIAPVTGTYYFEMTVGTDASPGHGVTYILTADVVTPIPCEVDPNEPNDTLATATPLSTSQVGYACGTTDNDWYSFQATAGDTIAAQVEYFSTAFGDADMELLDDQGVRLSLANFNSTTPDNLSPNNISAPYTGTYYLRVFNETVNSPYAGVPHQVNLFLQTPVCQTDAFEPIDSAASAVPF